MKRKNNLRNFRKIPNRIHALFIKVIAKFNHSLYMKKYVRYLKNNGMDIDGTPIYIGASTSFDGEDYSLIHIGDRTVISSDVRILTHDYSLSRAVESLGGKLDKEIYQVKDVVIGENCFVGTKSLLLPGCTLGNNVIVGAGSVVRGYFPDDVIVIGNPAVIIGNTKEWAKKKLASKGYKTNVN